jgi:WD40 repeat protein
MTTPQVSKVTTITGHRDSVYTLERSATPAIFFSGAGDGMVVAWDLTNPESGQLIARLPNSVYALHYQHSTGTLVAGHNYDGIHLLDWQNKRETGSLQLTQAAIFDIQSYDRYLYVATGEGSVIKVDATTLTVIAQTAPVLKSARALAINLKTGELAVGYSDHYIRVFNLDDLTLKLAWPAHTNSVFTVRYTPNGDFLLSGSRDARLKAWSSNNYNQAAEVVAHMYAINHLDFSPDQKHFVTCSLDKSIKVWSLEELRLLKVIDRARHAGHGTSVNKVLWSNHQDQIISASDDRTISVWNIFFKL